MNFEIRDENISGRFFRKRLFLIPATERGEDGIYMKQIISFCGEASKRTQDGLLQ